MAKRLLFQLWVKSHHRQQLSPTAPWMTAPTAMQVAPAVAPAALRVAPAVTTKIPALPGAPSDATAVPTQRSLFVPTVWLATTRTIVRAIVQLHAQLSSTASLTRTQTVKTRHKTARPAVPAASKVPLQDAVTQMSSSRARSSEAHTLGPVPGFKCSRKSVQAANVRWKTLKVKCNV